LPLAKAPRPIPIGTITQILMPSPTLPSANVEYEKLPQNRFTTPAKRRGIFIVFLFFTLSFFYLAPAITDNTSAASNTISLAWAKITYFFWL